MESGCLNFNKFGTVEFVFKKTCIAHFCRNFVGVGVEAKTKIINYNNIASRKKLGSCLFNGTAGAIIDKRGYSRFEKSRAFRLRGYDRQEGS